MYTKHYFDIVDLGELSHILTASDKCIDSLLTLVFCYVAGF